jgi:hypothetical protein
MARAALVQFSDAIGRAGPLKLGLLLAIKPDTVGCPTLTTPPYALSRESIEQAIMRKALAEAKAKLIER